jgi:hypothetical protein
MCLQHGRGREALLARRRVAQRHGAGQDRVERRLVLRLIVDPFHDRRLRVGEREGDLVRGERRQDRNGPFERAQLGDAEPAFAGFLGLLAFGPVVGRVPNRPRTRLGGWLPGTSGFAPGAARRLGLGVDQVKDRVQVIQPRLAVVLQRPHHLEPLEAQLAGVGVGRFTRLLDRWLLAQRS